MNMHIGEVAKSTKLSVDTIRFYEKSGLLEKPLRGPGGFRVYSSEDVTALQFIRGVQELGFSLEEIRELLRLRAREVRACAAVRDLLDQKLQGVRQKIDDLQHLEKELLTALRKCNLELSRQGKKRPPRCPILEGEAAARGGGAA
jgi:DNA-binding transcriptional MerR regulator